MHPDYESRRPGRARRGEGSEQPITARVPADLLKAVDLIAEAEDDNRTGIVLEGLMRVVDNRKEDESYVNRIVSGQNAKILRLQAELEDSKAVIAEFLTPSDSSNVPDL